MAKSYWKYLLTNLTALNQKMEINPSSAKSGKQIPTRPIPTMPKKSMLKKTQLKLLMCLFPPPISITLLLNNFQGCGL